MEPDSPSFDFTPRTRVVFGPRSLGRLGELAVGLVGQRVLLVTDPGIERAGHAERATASLAAAGLGVTLFDEVVENPTTRVVESCVEVARRAKVDLIVGLGGGSSLDTAKGCNFLLSNGGKMEDYWGVGKATQPMLPLIAIPTTAGTGSECQSFALICQEKTHVKMACGDPQAAPRIAILDPELTLTQPPVVAAATGMDAVAHAVESAVTRARTPLSGMFARESLRRCVRGLPRVLADPCDIEARGDVLLGAALGGMAIENSMLGAAHAAANPLTARFGVVHGRAVGVMLPPVIRFNAVEPEARALYGELALGAGLLDRPRDRATASDALVTFVEQYRESAGLPQTLAEAGVLGADLGELATDAARQWTARFNPRPPSADDFVRIYESVAGNRIHEPVETMP